MPMELDTLLEFAVKKGVSDVHLKQGTPPAFRISGTLVAQNTTADLGGEDMALFLDRLLTDDRKRRIFGEKGAVDLSYTLAQGARFRINIFRQVTGVSLVARVISSSIPSLTELSLPKSLENLAKERRGLILVTGATGSGKSTTLASILNCINLNRQCHILTIEDPVEYLIENRKAVVNQVEVGECADSFASALRFAMRQDPDVILIGELRDQETMETALQAAETGHLVLSTMHTTDAVESVNRMVSVFPPHHQTEIRRQLAAVLRWIVSIRLLERKDRKGRVPACEILCNTARIQELILEQAGKGEITKLIARGSQVYGTQTFDQALMKLYTGGAISLEEALANSSNPSDFKLMASGIGGQSDNDYD